MRYSGQEDFVIGSVMSGRIRPEVENLLGFFVNLLALRVDLSGNPTFSELVLRSREIVFGAHEHGAFPFQHLGEVTQPTRRANSNPFAQVFLNMLNLWDRKKYPYRTFLSALSVGSICTCPGILYRLRLGKRTRAASHFSLQHRAVQGGHDRAHGDKSATFARSGSSLTPGADLGFTDVHSANKGPGRCRPRPSGGARCLGCQAIRRGRAAQGQCPKRGVERYPQGRIVSHREEIIARLRTDGSQGSEDRKLRHIARTPPLPLTAVQKRFWFLDKIGQGRSVPNVMFPLRFEGPIDFDAMMAAVTAILTRHEALLMRIGRLRRRAISRKSRRSRRPRGGRQSDRAAG